MRDLRHAEALVDIAEIDLTVLREMSDKILFSSPVFVFHARQTIEKLLKSWLVILQIKYQSTHGIAQLLQLIGNQDTEAEQFEDSRELSPYAVIVRYET